MHRLPGNKWLRRRRKACDLRSPHRNLRAKYERAVKKLTKDRDVPATFYNFPAEHRKHNRPPTPSRASSPRCATEPERTKALWPKTAMSMGFKLMMSAKKKWRKLDGKNRLPEIIQGVSSKTRSSKFKTPPDQAITNFGHNSFWIATFLSRSTITTGRISATTSRR